MSELNKYRSRFRSLALKSMPGIVDRSKFIKSCRVVEQIGHDCDEGWKIVTNNSERRFTHPRYRDKHGKPKLYKIGVLNKLNSSKKVVYKYLFPIVDPNLDIYELGFSFHNYKPVSNKFEIFWETRRGRRYSKYIQYRKYRDMIKEQHHPETKDKAVDKHEHDAEFEKYLIERNEKKRIMRELMEDEEEEKKKNENEFYEDDYNY